jgi:hypothetical protein
MIPYILLISALLLKINIESYLLNISTSWRLGIQIMTYNVLILSIFIAIYHYFEEKLHTDKTF